MLKLLYYDDKNLLITVTENMMLYQHAVMPEGETKEIIKVWTGSVPKIMRNCSLTYYCYFAVPPFLFCIMLYSDFTLALGL